VKAKEFFRKCQFILMLAMGIYPVGACIAVFIAPMMLPYMWILPVFYAGMCLLSFAVPAKLRLWLGILGTLAMVLPCLLLEDPNARSIMLTITAVYGALLLWSTGIPGWESTRELSVTWLGTGMGTLLAGCFIATYEPRLASAAMGIRICVFVYVFFAMLSLNRGSLSLASGGQRGFSKAMRQKNVLLTIGMFAIAFAVALIPSLMDLVLWLAGLVGILVQKIAALFPTEIAEETVAATTETTVATIGEEAVDVITDGMVLGQTSNATLVVMAIVVIAIMVPLTGYSMFVVGRAIWRGISRLAASIIDAAHTEAEDFQDEITDTRIEADSEYHRRKEARSLRMQMPANLSPGEKIRYYYSRMLSKNPQWLEHNTARENLPAEAARIYERARYSDHPVTESDVTAFRESSKPKPIDYRNLDETI